MSRIVQMTVFLSFHAIWYSVIYKYHIFLPIYTSICKMTNEIEWSKQINSLPFNNSSTSE